MMTLKRVVGDSRELFAWGEFENGAPSAHADPEHVLGFTWNLPATQYSEVDAVIYDIDASSPL